MKLPPENEKYDPTITDSAVALRSKASNTAPVIGAPSTINRSPLKKNRAAVPSTPKEPPSSTSESGAHANKNRLTSTF
jgi:hypothetical protein